MDSAKSFPSTRTRPRESFRELPSEYVEQGRFAASGGAHHTDKLSGHHFEINASQGRNFDFPGVIELSKDFR